MVVGVPAILAAVLVAEPLYWRLVPSACSLSKYLDNPSTATRCRYSGIVDFEIDFAARVSRDEYEAFYQRLVADSVKDPMLIDGSLASGASRRIEDPAADLVVEFQWRDGEMSVNYSRY